MMTRLSGFNILTLFRFIFTLLDHQYRCLCKPVIWIIRSQGLAVLKLYLKTTGVSQLCHTSPPLTSPVLLAALGIAVVRFVSSANSDLNKTEFIESVRYVLMESKELSFIVSGTTAHKLLNLQSSQLCVWSQFFTGRFLLVIP